MTYDDGDWLPDANGKREMERQSCPRSLCGQVRVRVYPIAPIFSHHQQVSRADIDHYSLVHTPFGRSLPFG